MEWQKENTDASRAGEPVPWETLVKSSKMTQIIKKETVNNMHDHFAHITPKGKRLQLLRDILCEQRPRSATYFITILLMGCGKRTAGKGREKRDRFKDCHFLSSSFFLIFSLQKKL